MSRLAAKLRKVELDAQAASRIVKAVGAGEPFVRAPKTMAGVTAGG